MRTNIWLAIIALLLLLNLINSFNVKNFAPAQAQNQYMNRSKDTINVRIVGVGSGTFSIPVLYGNANVGYILPVRKDGTTKSFIGDENLLLPVTLVNSNR